MGHPVYFVLNIKVRTCPAWAGSGVDQGWAENIEAVGGQRLDTRGMRRLPRLSVRGRLRVQRLREPWTSCRETSRRS